MCEWLFQVERGSSPRQPIRSSFPSGRSTGWRGHRRWHGLGKLLGRSPSAAGPTRHPRPATLGLVADEVSRKRCLLDTGSQVSLWPASSTTSRLRSSRVQLTAANSTPIRSFGQQHWKIKIGGKSYSFVFLIAQVSRPILGLDLLQFFKMKIDLGKRRLINSGVETSLSSASRAISGVNVVGALSPFLRVLNDFPEVTDVALASSTTRHGVECFINTSGPPVTTVPRRLTPEKLKTARKYFEDMCAAGICRRSDSP